MSERGKYIVIEGLDGSGKTTQYQKLLDYLGNTALGVREPGGTPMAEDIRTSLKNPDIPRSPRTNVFLFSAARADLSDTVIRPALAAGQHVLSDRNWLSTLAMQTAEGADVSEITTLSKIACGDLLTPDLTLLIDLDPKICSSRLHARGGAEADFFDKKGITFFTRVREAYLKEVGQLSNAHIIDGSPPPDRVWESIEKVVKEAGL